MTHDPTYWSFLKSKHKVSYDLIRTLRMQYCISIFGVAPQRCYFTVESMAGYNSKSLIDKVNHLDRLYYLRKQSAERENRALSKNRQISRKLDAELYKLERSRAFSAKHCLQQSQWLQKECINIKTNSGLTLSERRLELLTMEEKRPYLLCERCRNREKRIIWKDIWAYYEESRKSKILLFSKYAKTLNQQV